MKIMSKDERKGIKLTKNFFPDPGVVLYGLAGELNDGFTHVTGISSIISSSRIYDALTTQFLDRLNAREFPLRDLILNPSAESDSQSTSTLSKENAPSLYLEICSKLKTALKNENYLNESQELAALNALYGSPVQLIQGPPGTGKTSTILAIILLLLGQGTRVLATAPTNVAISEVASRVVKYVKRNPDSSLLTLNEMVLIGNDERIENLQALDSIFIDAKANRIINFEDASKSIFTQTTGTLNFGVILGS
jgi:RecG-like helicase